MKKNIYITLFFVLGFSIFSSDLIAGGGSIYTRYGIGDLKFSLTARRLAFGEGGIALADFDYVNSFNPASFYQMRMTRIETGLDINGFAISNNSTNVFYNQVYFSGFKFGIPIDKDYGISLVMGMEPYSRVNYEITENDSSSLVDPYKVTYKGTGGLSKVYFGLSYKLPFDIAIGSSFEYYTGKIQHQSNAEFQSTSSFRNAYFNKDYIFTGVGFTFGLLTGNLSHLVGINAITDLRFGFSYSNSVNIPTDTVSTSSTTINSATALSYDDGYGQTHIPERLGIGASLKFKDSYLIILDYFYQPWSKYKFQNKTSNFYKDLNRFSIGLEYKKDPTKYNSFWEQVSVRGGLSYEQTQYTFYGANINETSIYFGFSAPIGFENTIDFAFQFGKRGTTENNLLSENIYRFSLTFNFGELWFIRLNR
ncbi:hypothetical protein ABRY23_03295 [Melioribacteraceae bacterium 4301-Me]|uniref:hypothetical protein n=1 Tax=Pyranulibacter aquaticus TaxID=3163344 RepID=UPI003599FF6C